MAAGVARQLGMRAKVLSGMENPLPSMPRDVPLAFRDGDVKISAINKSALFVRRRYSYAGAMTQLGKGDNILRCCYSADVDRAIGRGEEYSVDAGARL
eukprot:890776-Prorocentrum_minimum.AAC.1